MSDLRVFVRQSEQDTALENSWRAARGLRDGSVSVVDFKQAMLLAGKAYHVSVGAFSTPVAGGGAAAIIDIDRPRVAVAVPSGTSILPTRVSVQCQTPLLATDADESEILVAVDRSVAAVAGTSTAKTPVNLLIKATNPASSLATVSSIHTADLSVVPVLDVELARRVITGDMNGTPANALWGLLDLDYVPLTLPVITGPATLLVYWGGTVATTGFAQVQWIELASTFFS